MTVDPLNRHDGKRRVRFSFNPLVVGHEHHSRASHWNPDLYKPGDIEQVIDDSLRQLVGRTSMFIGLAEKPLDDIDHNHLAETLALVMREACALTAAACPDFSTEGTRWRPEKPDDGTGLMMQVADVLDAVRARSNDGHWSHPIVETRLVALFRAIERAAVYWNINLSAAHAKRLGQDLRSFGETPAYQHWFGDIDGTATLETIS